MPGPDFFTVSPTPTEMYPKMSDIVVGFISEHPPSTAKKRERSEFIDTNLAQPEPLNRQTAHDNFF